MKIRVTRLPKTERCPCTRRDVQSAFGGVDLAWVGLGWPFKRFSFDRRSTHRPKIRGTVVASATYSPQREAYVCVYVVRRAEYPAEAEDDFRTRVLPRMRRWLKQQIAKPDTAVLGHDKILVEWDGMTHQLHELTLRTGLSSKQKKEDDASASE